MHANDPHRDEPLHDTPTWRHVPNSARARTLANIITFRIGNFFDQYQVDISKSRRYFEDAQSATASVHGRASTFSHKLAVPIRVRALVALLRRLVKGHLWYF